MKPTCLCSTGSWKERDAWNLGQSQNSQMALGWIIYATHVKTWKGTFIFMYVANETFLVYHLTPFFFQSSLQDKLSALESTLQSRTVDHSNKEEALHKQVRDIKGQLQEAEAKTSKLETTLAEKVTKLKSVEQKLHEVESDLKTKVRFYVALNTFSLTCHLRVISVI